MTRHHFTFSTVTLVSLLAGGCAETEEPAPEPSASRAQALTEEVQEARDNPSGEVDGVRIEALLGAYANLDFAVGATGMPHGLDPLAFDGSCGVSGSGGVLDVSCATGGAANGSLTVDIGVEGSTSYVHYIYDNLCATDGDLCVSGEGAVEVSPAAVIVAGELTITHDGESRSVHYGVTVGTFGAEVVVWHEGSTYVISTDPLGGLGVEGANGSWHCDLSGALSPNSADVSGTCSAGDEQIDF